MHIGIHNQYSAICDRLFIWAVCMLACTGGIHATVVAHHYVESPTRTTWAYGWFILGQSFVIEHDQAVHAQTFSWIGVSGMPQSDIMYLFASQYTGPLEHMNSGTAGCIGSAQLISGTSTYEFTDSPLLVPGVQYFAYMSTSLLFDRYLDGQPVYGPAQTAVPSNFSGWNPSLPVNWFDSYPQGQAYCYLLDRFATLTEQQTGLLRYEYDFMFEVTGVVVPEFNSAFLFSLSVLFLTTRRGRQVPNKSRMAGGPRPSSSDQPRTNDGGAIAPTYKT